MKPDSRKCEYSHLVKQKEAPPSILFTQTALKWIKALVECHSSEVGFEGIVNEVGGAYVITEIFYPKHCLVNGGTCEISPEGEIEIAQKLIEENRAADISKVRLWGHSHHTMGTTPSTQDDEQAAEKMNKCGAYFIRAIVNKSGEMSVSFFDYSRQIKFENVKWTVAVDYEQIMNDVISVINKESTSRERVQSIKDILFAQVDLDDEEYKEIEKKVKELKETQLPKTQITTYLPHSSAAPYVPPNGNRNYFGSGSRDLYAQDNSVQQEFFGHNYPPGFDDGDVYFGDNFHERHHGRRDRKSKNKQTNSLTTKKNLPPNQSTQNNISLLTAEELEGVVNAVMSR